MTPRLFVLAALAAAAMVAAQAAAPDPLDARAATAPLVHRSAFDAYRRLGDEQAVPWREANETVKRIGGWRNYAREAAAPAAAASAPAAPPAAPARRP